MTAMITSIPITDRASWLALRRQDVTASECAALFGCHPYVTMASLYADKAGLLPPEEDAGGPTSRGIKLEPVVASQIEQAHPEWWVIKSDDYWRDDACRLGATPDYFIERNGSRGVIDIKTVEESKFKKIWKQEDGSLVPEPWIVLQVVQQVFLTGADFGMVGVMPISGWGSFDASVIEIGDRDKLEPVWRQIKDRAGAFWDRVARGEPPDFDYAQDMDAIKRLYRGGGDPIDLRADNWMRELLGHREILKGEIKLREEHLEMVEAEIRAKLGDAEQAIVNGWDVTLKTSTRKAYSVKETTYRTLRAKRLHSDRIME